MKTPYIPQLEKVTAYQSPFEKLTIEKMVAKYNIMIKTAQAMGVGIRRFQPKETFKDKKQGIKYLELVQTCINAYEQAKKPPVPVKPRQPRNNQERPFKMAIATVKGLPKLIKLPIKSEKSRVLDALAGGRALTIEEIQRIAWPGVTLDKVHEDVSRLLLEQIAVKISKKNLPYELVSRHHYGKQRYAICQKDQ